MGKVLCASCSSQQLGAIAMSEESDVAEESNANVQTSDESKKEAEQARLKKIFCPQCRSLQGI